MRNYKDFLRLGQAAEFLGVTPRSLREWSDAGRIPTYRDEIDRRLYKQEDLEAFLNKIQLEREPTQFEAM